MTEESFIAKTEEALKQISHLRDKPTHPPLTAYRVFYDDGTSRVTNCAAGITLEEATKYFVTGRPVEITETTFHKAIRVEKVD